VRARLAAAVERLRPLAPGVAWVARDNVHLTLKFLGNVETARLAEIERALAGAAGARIAPFDLDIHGLGAFPSRTRSRVLWAGVGAGGAEAAALAAGVEEALAGLGFPREPRPFAAHVTLGRVREPRANPRLADALDTSAPFGRQRVARVSLMRSELSSRGARYTELAGLRLGTCDHGGIGTGGCA
jgi:2'-5' RNA ligase